MATAATNSLLKVANVILDLDDKQDHIYPLCIGIRKSHLSLVIVGIYLVFAESPEKSMGGQLNFDGRELLMGRGIWCDTFR